MWICLILNSRGTDCLDQKTDPGFITGNTDERHNVCVKSAGELSWCPLSLSWKHIWVVFVKTKPITMNGLQNIVSSWPDAPKPNCIFRKQLLMCVDFLTDLPNTRELWGGRYSVVSLQHGGLETLRGFACCPRSPFPGIHIPDSPGCLAVVRCVCGEPSRSVSSPSQHRRKLKQIMKLSSWQVGVFPPLLTMNK